MNNMDLWNKVKQPPPAALKNIGGGRLKGMTDIKPQWRYEALTEHFGPCGIGWKYEIVKTWTEPGAGGEVMCFVIVHLSIHDTSYDADDPGKATWWSAPIPGIGGSMLVESERQGMHTNDEAFKMATTDALSVAAKMLGFGSDVYMGMWDGSKYRDLADAPPPTPVNRPENRPPPQPTNKAGGEPAPVEGFVAAITDKFAPRIGIKVDADWYNTEDHDIVTALRVAKEDHHRVMFDWTWRENGSAGKKSKYITRLSVFSQQGEVLHELVEGGE